MMTPRAAIFTRVAIYNHISNDPQGLEAGVERQRQAGAEPGQRTPDRVTHRNGYRPRQWDTRVGGIDRLVEQLGVAGMRKDQVGRLCRGLDEQVRVFRERPLEGRSP